MIENSSVWVVSDVDGTLMDHSYDLSPAKETIKKLQKLSIPVILCTSKTASEVKVIRKDLDLTDPYIVENGAAIYGESLQKVNGKIILGKKYETLEEILNLISKEIDFFNKNNITFVKLSDSILRTSTASINASSILNQWRIDLKLRN